MTNTTSIHAPPARQRHSGRTRPLVCSGALVVAGLFAAAAADAQTYRAVPITGLRANVNAISINKWGQVIGVGTGTVADPMLWTPKFDNGGVGKLLDLAKQPGFPANARVDNAGAPNAINDMGQVAGDASVTSGGDDNGQISWLWTPTTLNSAKGVLHATKGEATAFALFNDGEFPLAEHPTSINNQGQITGHGAYYNPELFTPSTPNTGTGTWVADNSVSATTFFMNDAGQFAGGFYGNSIPNYHGWDFAFVQNGFPPFSAASILTAPIWSLTSNADAIALNQLGHVLVSTVPTTENAVHSYLVENGVATDVTGVETFASALNDSDMVTGYMAPGCCAIPFIATGGSVFDLTELVPATVNGGTLTLAAYVYGINDVGQILIDGGDAAGDNLFLLTPAAMIDGKQPSVSSTGAHAIGGGQFTRTVKVTNTTGAVLPGPLSVMFEDLPAGVILAAPDGTTSFVGPSGTPFVDLAPGGLAINANMSVTVTFDAPSAASVTYVNRVLAGTAAR